MKCCYLELTGEIIKLEHFVVDDTPGSLLT